MSNFKMSKMCKSTQVQILTQYSNLKVGDGCPVCEHKIGYHDNPLPVAPPQGKQS